MKKLLLFDMDGVLLRPGGYHQSLKATVRGIGLTLGLPGVALTDDQIARFEALSITNEWDTLAICTALMLLETWQTNPDPRIDGNSVEGRKIIDQSPGIDSFLDSLDEVGPLPGHTAYKKIDSEHPYLNPGQKRHLQEILFDARDIYKSPVLHWHQETVLGSDVFWENYGLMPQLDRESYLTLYDRPNMAPEQREKLAVWLSYKGSGAGILTNRPSSTPPGYLSSPEAELGAQLVEMDTFPILGSGMLAWFAVTQCQLPEYTFLKPNPVHTLALMQLCSGHTATDALMLAYKLWRGDGKAKDWEQFAGCQVVIFEDAVKGMQSGESAQALLAQEHITVDLVLIGISSNPIKQAELKKMAQHVYEDINRVDWYRLSLS